jgi:hypothetical protein
MVSEVGAFTTKARGTIGPPPIDETLPLTERVKRLEHWRIATTANLNALYDGVANAREALQEEVEALRKTIANEAETIRSELREAVAADLTLEWIGLFWLVLGMSATSVSDEVERWTCFVYVALGSTLGGCP